jgi:hypothetical protein
MRVHKWNKGSLLAVVVVVGGIWSDIAFMNDSVPMDTFNRPANEAYSLRSIPST